MEDVYKQQNVSTQVWSKIKRYNLVPQHTYQYSSTKALRQRRRRRRCWGKVADVFGDALSPITASIEQPNVFWWEGWTRWMRRVETCRLRWVAPMGIAGIDHTDALHAWILSPKKPHKLLLYCCWGWNGIELNSPSSSTEINLPPGPWCQWRCWR